MVWEVRNYEGVEHCVTGVIDIESSLGGELIGKNHHPLVVVGKVLPLGGASGQNLPNNHSWVMIFAYQLTTQA